MPYRDEPTPTPPPHTHPTGAEPTGAEPTGAQPTGAQPTGAQPTGAQPSGTRRSSAEERTARGPSPDGRLWRVGRAPVWLLGLSALMIVGASAVFVVALVRHDDSVATPSADGANPAAPGPGATAAPDATSAPARPTSAAPPPGTAPMPGQRGCAGKPSACGYPDVTNTGVPSGTNLTVVDGDLTVNTPGAVVEGKDVHGCILIGAPNVTIRRSKVTCTGAYGIGNFTETYSGGGLVIEDVEIDCANSSATAIGDYGLTARRVNVHNCENGFDIDSGVTVVDSYLHDMRPTSTGHTDGIQLAGGSTIAIRHNTIFNPGGTSAIISHPDANSNVTIEDNLLAGGAYTLYCPRDSSTNFRVINNRFSTIFSPTSGAYGPWDSCEKVAENRGNVWDSTLAPLND